MTDLGNDQELRRRALISLGRRREFRIHLRVYVAVNALLVVVWAMNGGLFWPVFPILGWGLGLSLHAWQVYAAKPISEQEIEREIERLS